MKEACVVNMSFGTPAHCLLPQIFPWLGAMQVLFLCTGNYYRSRFAEAVFNHHAGRAGIPARAFSRGLATYLVKDFPDRISPDTVAALHELGIPLSCTAPYPQQVSNADLAVSHRIIALKHSEHHAMLQLLHPGWEEHVEYWDIHDTDDAPATTQLPRVQKAVLALLDACEAALKR